MNEHYFVTADQGRVRIFRARADAGQRDPALDLVVAMDFPAGVHSFTSRDAGMAGRFQSSQNQGAGDGAPAGRMGMSIDERLPMRREADRRRARDVAAAIDNFFAPRPGATWDLAATEEIHREVTGQLSPPVRDRLQHVIAKDLVDQPLPDVGSHFIHLAHA